MAVRRHGHPGSLVLVISASHADRPEHPFELGPCARSAAGAQVSFGSNVRSRSICAVRCTASSDPPSTIGSSPTGLLVTHRSSGRQASRQVMGEPATGAGWFPACVMTMRLQPRLDRLPRHRSQRAFRRSSSGNAHLPASCKSRSSRENPGVEAGAVEHAGQTFAQEDVVGREHHTVDCGHTDH
jgi:hypothetical protein